MKRGGAFLMGVGSGLVLAWLLDRRGGSAPARAWSAADRLAGRARRLVGGADDAELVAPATPMSGEAGAEAVRAASPAVPAVADELVVRPTPATAGVLPLTDEAAGGHLVLGGGQAAPDGGDDADGRSSPAAPIREGAQARAHRAE